MSQSPTPPENSNGANPIEEEELSPSEQKQEQLETEGTSSPAAQGEINGGPLGCCLGVMVGLLLSLSVALISRFYADTLAQVFGGALSLVVRITMVLAAIIAVGICGKFGWKIGKKFYREYDPPVLKR